MKRRFQAWLVEGNEVEGCLPIMLFKDRDAGMEYLRKEWHYRLTPISVIVTIEEVE